MAQVKGSQSCTVTPDELILPEFFQYSYFQFYLSSIIIGLLSFWFPYEYYCPPSYTLPSFFLSYRYPYPAFLV